MSRRLRIGLTGGVASGKTTAGLRFVELGIPVIDADESGRLVVAPGQPGLTAVKRAFGAEILTPAGELDRRALRSVVFGQPARRRELEGILHPLIQADMERRAEAAEGPYVVFAIPLLVEQGPTDRIDRILVVDIPEELQLQRVLQRDGGTIEQAEAILKAQVGRKARLGEADDVIDNTGSIFALRAAVDGLHQRYLTLAKLRAANLT